MKTSFNLSYFLFTGFLLLAGHESAWAQVAVTKPAPVGATTVYLVRHAEKDTANRATDPGLSTLGERRALALRELLTRRQPAALFTTDTKRTRATLAPLAAGINLTPQVYDPKDPNALAKRIRTEYAGKSVVVVGHSNTLLPAIEALNGTAPVEEIREADYDYLFTVRIPSGDDTVPTVDMRGYGPQQRLSMAERPQITLPKLGKSDNADTPRKTKVKVKATKPE